MTATLRLYDTVDQLEIVRQWIDEHSDEIIAAGGELPPELAALLDQAEGQLTEKVERVGLYVRELLLTSKAIEEEAQRLHDAAVAKLKAANHLKEYLRGQLERAEITTVKGKLLTVRVQKNPPSVQCADPATLYTELGEEWIERRVVESFVVRRDYVLAAYKANEPPIPLGIDVTQGSHVRLV